MMSTRDLAWLKGEASYVEGDSVADVGRKAEKEGYKPGSEAYSQFLRGFLSASEGKVPKHQKTPPDAG